MRVSFLVQIAFGVLMTGCTYNNTSTYHISDDDSIVTYHLTDIDENEVERTVVNAPVIECSKYTALPAPRPAKVSVEAVKKASSEEEINKILLKNISDLHNQLRNHAKQQGEHLNNWIANCNQR